RPGAADPRGERDRRVAGPRSGRSDLCLRGSFRPRSFPARRRGGKNSSSRGVAQEELDDHAVAPLAVERAVPAVDAHLTKAERTAEREAGLVLREDPADELPVPLP